MSDLVRQIESVKNQKIKIALSYEDWGIVEKILTYIISHTREEKGEVKTSGVVSTGMNVKEWKNLREINTQIVKIRMNYFFSKVKYDFKGDK